MLYCHLQHHNDTIIKTQEDLFINICTSHFIVRVWRLVWGSTVRGSWRPNRNCSILTPTLMAVSVVSCSFSRCSTVGPGTQLSAGWWLSLLHLITNFSGPQLIKAPRPPPPGFLYHILSSNSSILQLQPSWLLSWLSPTSTQSPTRSLTSHVWLSSSGNNCHIVHSSLSSGASVYECTMGIFLPRHISSANFRPPDFLS